MKLVTILHQNPAYAAPVDFIVILLHYDWNMSFSTQIEKIFSEIYITRDYLITWHIEAHKNGAAEDVLWCEILGDIREYRSKHHKPKWKPVQHHLRTLPELKSIWFDIIEKILEFDEKKVGNALKIASQGALWSSP